MFCTAQGVLQDYKNYVLPAGLCLEDNSIVERYAQTDVFIYILSSVGFTNVVRTV